MFLFWIKLSSLLPFTFALSLFLTKKNSSHTPTSHGSQSDGNKNNCISKTAMATRFPFLSSDVPVLGL
jgi:hypothetical protein